MRKSVLFLLLATTILTSACLDRSSGHTNSEGGASDNREDGVPAPEFHLPRLSGGERESKDYHGKLLLLNFWATWCAPCVAEMPSLERLYRALKDKGLMVAAISVDPASAHEDLQAFVQKNGLTFDILQDVELDLPPKFGVTGFPETFIVGPDGRFIPFTDPDTGTTGIKVVSDRIWDSPEYLQAVEKLLEKVQSDSNHS